MSALTLEKVREIRQTAEAMLIGASCSETIALCDLAARELERHPVGVWKAADELKPGDKLVTCHAGEVVLSVAEYPDGDVSVAFDGRAGTWLTNPRTRVCVERESTTGEE